MNLTLRNLKKHYPGVAALNGIDLEIPSGELVALLGPSGSGKTTLLRVIAGLLSPDDGEVRFAERDATHLSLRERNVGFVFQHYALFRHMSVAENIAFGLRSRPRATRPGKAEIARRVEELLRLIQLPEHGGRYPEQLSGGQKQRVALARALAIDPAVLLLDEPFGALDAKVRVELRRWLRRLHDQTGQTTIFVTHDQEEAMELADRVVVLREGRIEQIGTPGQIYAEPASAYVFDFIGRSNAIPGRVNNGVFEADDASGTLDAAGVDDGPVIAMFRPHQATPSADTGTGLRSRVLHVHRRADRITLDLSVGDNGRTIEWERMFDDARDVPNPGDRFHLRPSHPRFFPIAPTSAAPARALPQTATPSLSLA